MPYVNIKITREGATAEQKAKSIAGATQLRIAVLPNLTEKISHSAFPLHQPRKSPYETYPHPDE